MCRQAQLLLAAAVGAAEVQRAAACNGDWCWPNFPSIPVQPNGHVALTAVSCGGHFAQTCGECAARLGEDFCHGQCMWLFGDCIRPTWADWFMRIFLDCFIYWYRWLPYMFFLGVVMTAYACAYKHKVVDELPSKKMDKQDEAYYKDREVGLFACFGKPSTCLWATFCTPVLAAKNYSAGGVMGFWPSYLFVWIGLYTLFWPLYCVMAVFRTSMSANLKQRLGFEPKFWPDFFVTLCCFPCEVGRESIEVDDELKVDIECAFEVKQPGLFG